MPRCPECDSTDLRTATHNDGPEFDFLPGNGAVLFCGDCDATLGVTTT